MPYKNYLRENNERTHLQLIILTAFAIPEDRERCLAAGANDYLIKPADLKLLTQTIEKFTGSVSQKSCTDQG